MEGQASSIIDKRADLGQNIQSLEKKQLQKNCDKQKYKKKKKNNYVKQ